MIAFNLQEEKNKYGLFIATEKPQLKEAVKLMIGFNLEMNKAVGILSDIQCYSLFKEYTLLLGLQ